eukprot:2173467-Amphidinium_carterae.1
MHQRIIAHRLAIDATEAGSTNDGTIGISTKSQSLRAASTFVNETYSPFGPCHVRDNHQSQQMAHPAKLLTEVPGFPHAPLDAVHEEHANDKVYNSELPRWPSRDLSSCQ